LTFLGNITESFETIQLSQLTITTEKRKREKERFCISACL
jgi:hypothetical protein